MEKIVPTKNSTVLNNPNRNETLDVLKLIASYFIVLVHVRFHGTVGIVFALLSKFAVPLFFAVSGFFCYQSSIDKVKKKFFRTLKLYIVATLTYHIFNCITLLISGGSSALLFYLKDLITIRSLIKVYVVNSVISSNHLWFLLSLLYVYMVQLILLKLKFKEVWIYILALISLVLGLILGEFLPFFGIQVDSVIIRNFALMGFPCFTIGMFLKKHEDFFKNINYIYLIISFVLGLVFIALSWYYGGDKDLYLGALLVMLPLFIFAMKHQNAKFNNNILKWANCSTNIYIFHMLIYYTIVFIFEQCGISLTQMLIKNTLAISVCILATLLAFIILFIQTRLKQKRKKDSPDVQERQAS